MTAEYWAKLSKQEKIIAYVAIAFIIIAFFDRLILDTILDKMSSIENQISLKELLIKKDSRILSQKDVIGSQQQQYSAYAVQANSEAEEISAVLKEIDTLAKQAGVNLIETKPTELVSEKIIKRYSILLICEGTMGQLANFLFQIENSKTLFMVEKYDLSSRDREKGIVKCVMSISKIVVP